MSKKIIIFLVVFCSLLVLPQSLKAHEIEIKKVLTLDEHLHQVFGDKGPLMKAVLKHESGLNLKAINYNCKYNGRSTFCKKGDRKLATSVDCGLFQLNVRGKVCPKEYFTIEGSMPKVTHIYKTQGLKAWVSYNNKKYKAYM